MFVCVDCDSKGRDFLNQAIALTECDCCKRKQWCIHVRKEGSPCQK